MWLASNWLQEFVTAKIKVSGHPCDIKYIILYDQSVGLYYKLCLYLAAYRYLGIRYSRIPDKSFVRYFYVFYQVGGKKTPEKNLTEKKPRNININVNTCILYS